MEAAKAAQAEALEREREEMFKRRLPSRDRQGRRILPPAREEKGAKDVLTNNPLQVLMLWGVHAVCNVFVCRTIVMTITVG